MKIKRDIKSDRSKKSNSADLIDGAVVKKIETLLRMLEKEESKYEKLKRKFDKTLTSVKNTNDQLKKVLTENRNAKKRITILQEQIRTLNDTLEGIQRNYQISAEASVDLLSDLEYNTFKSRFVDIDMEYPPSIEKLKEYGNNIKGFFLQDMHCTHVYIHCNGITEDLQNLLHISIKRKQKDSVSFEFNQSKAYYYDLEDVDLPERKLGRIVIGRYPYKSKEKEDSYDARIKSEILMTKRLLEKCIIEIQNKELAIKDALTGLHSRKFLVERLTEEFNSMDLFFKLSVNESNLLKVIMNSEGAPGFIVKNQYFAKYKTRDEDVYNKSLHKLKTLSIISTDSVKYAGEWHDCYFFESSKMSCELYLAVLDLDHFKDVNDNWGGHAVGDRVLRDFADIIKNNIRLTDIPVRYGGEEFIIIFPRSSNYSRIFDVLEKIRLDCEDKLIVSWRGKKRNITVSIGVTQINKFDRNVNYIINRADAALYKAKKRRNRIIMCIQNDEGELKYS